MISGRHLSGIDSVGLAFHHDSGMSVYAGDAHLNRREIAAPDRVLLRHLLDVRDLGLDLNRAVQRAGCRNCFARLRR